MERVVFRPLRTASPAVMLVTTFAVAFLLQSIALLKFGHARRAGRPRSRRWRSRSRSHGIDVRKITLVARRLRRDRAGRARPLLIGRTRIGLHMRAAAADFSTARMLGVRANSVILFAVVLSGALAATVSVILTVTNPLVTPDFALRETIIVLVGVVVGGINRPVSATLGGFLIGFTTGLLGGILPTEKSVFLPTSCSRS